MRRDEPVSSRDSWIRQGLTAKLIFGNASFEELPEHMRLYPAPFSRPSHLSLSLFFPDVSLAVNSEP